MKILDSSTGQDEEYINLFLEKSVNYYKMYKNIMSNNLYLDSFPTEIFFETSNVCNARCIMCAKFSTNLNEHRRDCKNSGLMKLRYIENIYRSRFLNCCFLTHLHGFGEPLLNRNIIKFVQLLRLKDCSIDFFTNGRFLTENLAKKLVDYSVEKIYVSFYGGTKNTYEYVMQRCDFDIVINNLRYINSYKKDTSSILPEICFTLAVMKSNFRELPLIAKVAGSVGASTLRLSNLIVYDFIPELNKEYKKFNPFDPTVYWILFNTRKICIKNNINFVLDDFISTRKIKRSEVRTTEINTSIMIRIINYFKNTTRNFLNNINLRYKKQDCPKIKNSGNLRIKYNEYSHEELHQIVVKNDKDVKCNPINIKDSDIIHIFEKDSFPYVDTYVPLNKQTNNYYKSVSELYSRQYPVYCFQPFVTIFIRQDGKVKPCCFWRDDYHGFEFGNVNTQEIEDIWNGEKFQALRGTITKGFVHFSCYNCLTLGQIPRSLGYPVTINIKKIDGTEFLDTIRKYNIVGEVSGRYTKNSKFVGITTRTENDDIILTCTNEDPQIIFDTLNEDILIYIKMYVTAKLEKNRSLEVFYSYDNQNFTENNKISLSIIEGENFLWCFIPNEKKIPITGIRIDPVSEKMILNVQFILVVNPHDLERRQY